MHAFQRRAILRSLRGAAIFAGALGLLVGASHWAWLTIPELSDRVRNISLAQRPPGDDYYLAHDRGGHVDHHVLYHGTDPEALANLKQADIIFVGNSRMMFALRARVLAPWAAAHGLRYYALGFGHRDGDEWVTEIIRKHDLRPRLVVANVDAFFGRARSAWADRVRRDSAFGAGKLQLEVEGGHEVRRVLHRVLPNWIDLFGRPGFPFGNEFIAYRSRVDGTWSISPWPAPQMPAHALDFGSGPVGPRVGVPARAFKAEVDRRGAFLALTYVPTPDNTGDNPVALGAMLGVPVAGLDVDGLTSHDGSHLSEASAVAWTRRLTEDLTPLLARLPPR